jgi:hypothetical protein
MSASHGTGINAFTHLASGRSMSRSRSCQCHEKHHKLCILYTVGKFDYNTDLQDHGQREVEKC